MSVDALTYDREAERANSAEVLAQAQWLFEQHEHRVQNCQTMAIGLLTVTGTVLAVTPSLLPEAPPWVLLILPAVVGVAGIGTIVYCLRVLIPRTRTNGLPAVSALRELANRHETAPQTLSVPVTQFAADLLNPMQLTEPAPLSQAAADAARRTSALTHAYGWFAATFIAIIAMTSVIQFTH
ncbi:hypothetical protein H5399_17155 [Tessaracoccus sp. MC1627]|uniref:hypothetical protein n=1 Tax=Tessaracoccus sp. MC1627 TaxID=2760312 RepID=UPI001602D422|nr:hypothetical protein [Tessaracoccus sp. MC1627]MBB1514312.1 hypothetical protein [Tessaracoccus sp. MC1627]